MLSLQICPETIELTTGGTALPAVTAGDPIIAKLQAILSFLTGRGLAVAAERQRHAQLSTPVQQPMYHAADERCTETECH